MAMMLMIIIGVSLFVGLCVGALVCYLVHVRERRIGRGGTPRGTKVSNHEYNGIVTGGVTGGTTYWNQSDENGVRSGTRTTSVMRAVVPLNKQTSRPLL
jgi:hypothetical protein